MYGSGFKCWRFLFIGVVGWAMACSVALASCPVEIGTTINRDSYGWSFIEIYSEYPPAGWFVGQTRCGSVTNYCNVEKKFSNCDSQSICDLEVVGDCSPTAPALDCSSDVLASLCSQVIQNTAQIAGNVSTLDSFGNAIVANANKANENFNDIGTLYNRMNETNSSFNTGLNQLSNSINVGNASLRDVVTSTTTIIPQAVTNLQSSNESHFDDLINAVNSSGTTDLTDVESNTLGTKTNTGEIADNTLSIKAGVDTVADNTAGVLTNTQTTANNTADIKSNTQTTANNTADIKSNTQTTATNTAAIKNSAASTASNTAAININMSSMRLSAATTASAAVATANNTAAIKSSAASTATNTAAIKNSAASTAVNTLAIKSILSTTSDNTAAIKYSLLNTEVHNRRTSENTAAIKNSAAATANNTAAIKNSAAATANNTADIKNSAAATAGNTVAIKSILSTTSDNTAAIKYSLLNTEVHNRRTSENTAAINSNIDTTNGILRDLKNEGLTVDTAPVEQKIEESNEWLGGIFNFFNGAGDDVDENQLAGDLAADAFGSSVIPESVFNFDQLDRSGFLTVPAALPVIQLDITPIDVQLSFDFNTLSPLFELLRILMWISASFIALRISLEV